MQKHEKESPMRSDFYSPDSKCAQAHRGWIASPAYTPITADTVLGAARQFDKYMRRQSRRDYEMRVFEDGSVFFRNTAQPTLRQLLSLADIQAASRDFWMSPSRALWQHIAALWL
ncbi:hypothetical protein [Bradyrhizobium sp. sGM-13]|uniref:hypothetical protein n=1 Tax=Bradyrhizobium sp. sGM-13 TaxID=2831781 RepID=UPI001BCAE491|nr:hypothetical protein [Bradyrhizobium sp. sGM-13]